MLSFQIILSLRFTILTLFYFILFITHRLNGCEKFCDKIITLEILSNIIYNIPTLKKKKKHHTHLWSLAPKCYWRAESTSIIGQPKSTYRRGITCCLKILIISILLAFKACVYFHLVLCISIFSHVWFVFILACYTSKFPIWLIMFYSIFCLDFYVSRFSFSFSILALNETKNFET